LPLPNVRLLRFAVTPIRVPALALANAPDNTLPVNVEASEMAEHSHMIYTYDLVV
jgi:hypothetical protein